MESISLEFTETDVENSNYGQKMEYDASGPYEKKRTKTDSCWLIGFIVYLIIWKIVIIYAFITGDTSKWLKPQDSAGRICGYDSGVESKPYVMRYNTENRDYFVCRSHCPENDFVFEDEIDSNSQIKESTSTTVAVPEVRHPFSDVDEEKQKQKADSNGNSEEPKKLSEEKRKAAAKKKTSEEKTKSDNEKSTPEKKTESESEKNTPEEKTRDNGDSKVQSKESSNLLPTKTQRIDDSNNDSSISSKTKLDRMKKSIICMSEVNLELIDNYENLKYLVEMGKCSRSYKRTDCGLNVTAYTDLRKSYLVEVTRDLSNTKFSIISFIMLSGAIALTSILLMRWYAMMYVCISIFVMCAMAFYFIYNKCVLNADNKTNGVLLALFLGVVIVVLIVLIAIYFRQQIMLACQMIRESSKAITCVLSSLAVPLISFVLYVIIFILGVSAYFLLTSLESPVYRADFANERETCECPSNLGYTKDSICEPTTFNAQCRNTSGGACVLSGCYMVKHKSANVGFLHFLNIAGLIYNFWFVTGFNDTVLASVFSTWYWTFNKKILSYMSVIESFWRIIIYHLGSIVLGSLLVIICTIVRTILKAIEKSLRKSKKPLAATILLCLKSVLDFMESSVNFIDRKAYIMCAMHGTDFFQSARMAYYLMMRNAKRTVAVGTVTSCLTFIVTLLIACITTGISKSHYETYEKDELTSPFTPVLFVFLGSYAITCMFMRVVEVAVNTIYLCFLEDTERNDGTNEKPYFMSEGLTKFLYKK